MSAARSNALTKVPEVTLGFWILKNSRYDARRDRRQRGHDVDGTGLRDRHDHLWRRIPVGGDRTDLRREFQPLPLLADDRRDDYRGHNDGRFRRPLARDRLCGRICASARAALRVARDLALGRGNSLVNTVATPRVEAFYWATILFSQTLGTALGDWMADTNGLGFGGGAVVFGAALVAIAAAYYFTNVSRVALFWAAFILTRPLGATVGDLLDKPLALGGLEFSRYYASAVLIAAILALIVVFPQRAGLHRSAKRAG